MANLGEEAEAEGALQRLGEEHDDVLLVVVLERRLYGHHGADVGQLELGKQPVEHGQRLLQLGRQLLRRLLMVAAQALLAQQLPHLRSPKIPKKNSSINLSHPKNGATFVSLKKTRYNSFVVPPEKTHI